MNRLVIASFSLAGLFAGQAYATEQACADVNGTDVLIAAENLSASELQNNGEEFYRDLASEVQEMYGSNVNHGNAIGPSLIFTACGSAFGVTACTDYHFPDIPFNGQVSIEQAILDWAGVETDTDNPAAQCDPSKNINTTNNTSSSGGGSGAGGYFGGATPWPGTVWQNPDTIPTGTVTWEEV